MDYSESINLLKFKNAIITKCEGKTTTKRGIFIPIEDNDLQEYRDENLKPKGLFLNLIVWQLKEEGKYRETHIIKQALSRDFRESLTEEELKNMPILGNMKPLEKAPVSNEILVEVKATEEDLPF